MAICLKEVLYNLCSKNKCNDQLCSAQLICICVLYMYMRKSSFLVLWLIHLIMKTCTCNEYPLKPHFYIEKLGFACLHLFFLFLLQNIDCGYSLEPLRRGGSNVYPQSVLSKNKENIKNFLLNIFIFYKFKHLCILHG